MKQAIGIDFGLIPRVKLGQNGTVSFPIRLDACGQRPRLYETTFDECGSRNVECGRMESLRSVSLIK